MHLKNNLKCKILISFVVLILITLLVVVVTKQENRLEVYAIKYGDSLYHSRHIYYDDLLNKPVPFAWMFYVIKYNKKIILVDTGFREESFIKSFNIDYKNPLTLLKQINIDPLQVTDVIITHTHFDHVGNVDKFTNATIYIQNDELDNFKQQSNNQRLIDFFENNKNIITFDETYNLYNLFKIEKIGGHTIGSSVVFFNYGNKNYILAGDECYFIDNCQGKAIGTYYDIKKNRKFIEQISRIENKIILTFHDPLIFNKYQRVNDSIAKVI